MEIECRVLVLTKCKRYFKEDNDAERICFVRNSY